MIERLLAIFAFVVLGGFLFILGWKVHRVDLTVVILIEGQRRREHAFVLQ